MKPEIEDTDIIIRRAANGWTQDAGIFSVPVHLVFIPDVNDYYRVAVTTGINW